MHDIIRRFPAFIEFPKNFHAASINQLPAKRGNTPITGEETPDTPDEPVALDANDVLQGLVAIGWASVASIASGYSVTSFLVVIGEPQGKEALDQVLLGMGIDYLWVCCRWWWIVKRLPGPNLWATADLPSRTK